MPETVIDIVKKRIADRHHDDEKQLEVVFTDSPRILVEAPAGYGKTNTMVSKIAYMLATMQIPYPKRLLALTFSVNAAYKIKKDVREQIPALLENTGIAVNVSDKIFISNYHGFCRNVLKKHGGKIHSSLFDIDRLQSIDDSNIKFLTETFKGFSYENAEKLSIFNENVKQSNIKYLKDNIDEYNNIVVSELLPHGSIPFNAILSLTIKLFIDNSNILDFYHKYFSAILVDEYQDTNLLSFWILKKIISVNTKVIFLGDSLQRIYGFIGAIPNLLDKSESGFNMQKIRLEKNYRFADNPQMLLLDFNIRKNAENPSNPVIAENAIIDFQNFQDQTKESCAIAKIAVSLIKSAPTSKVAILVKQRYQNTERILEVFNYYKIPYFYGLYTDEDPIYISFHRRCLFEFLELIKNKRRLSKKISVEHISKIKDKFKDNKDSLIDALFVLLSIFWDRAFQANQHLSDEEKISFVIESFENNSLKQYVEFVVSNIIISTIHAAKGLEWDYVILPDMEQDLFPNWFGSCNNCKYRTDCKIVVNSENEKKFIEELSVFYVAVTRARKQVFFTSSENQLDKYGKNRSKNQSCFINLPGIIHK